MDRISIISLTLVAFTILVAGCCGTSSSSPSTVPPAATANEQTASLKTTSPTTIIPTRTSVVATTSNTADLSSVTELVVSPVQDTWDSDIQYDGNEITLYFRDAEDKPVEFENGPNVPVTIEIWMTESGSPTTLERRQVELVYKKSGIMNSSFYRFRVPFEDTPIPTDKQGEAFYPAVYAKATTPDGKTFEAMQPLGLKPLN